MRWFIYSRVSTLSQEAANQTIQLKAQFPDAVVVEEIGSGGRARPALENLVEELRAGDVLVVQALDRLGRKTSEILGLIESLLSRGVVLKSMREGLDYSTPAGRLVMQILVSVSELEKSLISIRTREALCAKRKLGIVGGRSPVFSQATVDRALTMKKNGESVRAISRATGISSSRLYELFRGAGSKPRP